MRALPLWIVVVVAACNSSPPAHPDAAVDAAPTIDGPFACGTSSCDKTTQYCYQVAAGFQPAGCTALPAACASQPTCDCIKPTITDCASGLVACEQQDGEVTAVCNLP